MYNQLLANYEATNRMNIAAQRYADILMVISDSKISQEEVSLLAKKWDLTNYEVVKYIASVTGNVNLGSGWDAAGLAAADGWKTALADLNAYLTAVGKGAFVAPQNVPATPVSPSLAAAAAEAKASAERVKTIAEQLAAKIAATNKIPDTPTLSGASQSSLPGFQDYRAGERAGISVVVNNAGSVVTSDDLNETVRNGILAGQTSGRSINARVLDL
jgi:hypothetical protein